MVSNIRETIYDIKYPCGVLYNRVHAYPIKTIAPNSNGIIHRNIQYIFDIKLSDIFQ